MISVTSDNKDAIAGPRRQYDVRTLDLFGSAATGAFDPVTSDFDSVVDLDEYERGVARRFMRFAEALEALEALLGRKVDLITEDSIVNPYFRYVVDRARESTSEAGEAGDRPTAA